MQTERINTTNMSKNTTKNDVNDRFTPSWKCHEWRSRENPHSGSITDRTSEEVHKDPLFDYEACTTDQKNKKDPCFVHKNETMWSTMEKSMRKFEHNYMGVTLELVSHDVKEQQVALENMFEKDPLGLTTVPYKQQHALLANVDGGRRRPH